MLLFNNNYILFKSIYLIVICGIFLGCNKNSNIATTEDYKLFSLEQQGWKSRSITKTVNDINFTATEVPLQYYILKNTEGSGREVDSIYQINKTERIIEVEFQHVDQTDLLKEQYTAKDYTQSVEYLAFKIKNDFSVLTESNDTIRCSGVHFERNFKVAPFKRILLYFGDINPDETIELLYNDQLWGNGKMQFNFKEVPIKT